MTKRFWQVSSILSVLFALTANILVGAQILDLTAIKEMSDKYATLLTPASYAFSIWSLIYLLLVGFTVYQARDIIKPRKENDLPQKAGLLFIIANIGNGLWTYIFVSDLVGLSVIILLLMTASLYALLWRLRIAVYDAPKATIMLVWWPLLMYTGWVTVASVVNIDSWLASIGVILSPIVSCIVLVALMASLLVLLRKRNVRELLLASTWGIIAIGVQQIHHTDTVAYTAFAVSGILIAAISLHAYKNRFSSAFMRSKRN